MWITSSEVSPSESSWFIIYVNGVRFPARYNKFNNFWIDSAGKTYKPEQIDKWLDDSKIEETK
jgi:hypothetical protein